VVSGNGADWDSYHIFYDGDYEGLLSRLVTPVVCELWVRRHINRFFFIRYGLGGSHVRLRLLCAPSSREEVESIVLRAANKFFKHSPSERHAEDHEIRRQNRQFSANPSDANLVYPNDSVVKVPFDPEIERYGGPDLVKDSLEFFCVSSACVLQLISRHEEEVRARRLFHSLRILLRQTLGFGPYFTNLKKFLSVAALGNGSAVSLLMERAGQEFERDREGYVALIRQEIEKSRDPAARLGLADCLVTEAARSLGERMRNASDQVRLQVMGSQLHMTFNRLGLKKMEEVYVAQILKAALSASAGLDGECWSSVACGNGLAPQGSELEELVTKSLDQLALVRVQGDCMSREEHAR
jgi:hypothetical protein